MTTNQEGRQGDPGPAGRQGEAGPGGREGGPGERGRVGPSGDAGPAGRRGPQGEQPKLRWAPAVGYALLIVLLLVLFAWTVREAQDQDALEQRVERLETDVSRLRE